jgi:glycine dehydrogenase subunit 2
MRTRTEPLIFELGSEGRSAYSLPPLDVPERDLESLVPAEYLRDEKPQLPEVSEVDLVRHYTRMSQLNHGVDTGFYPLGSCTMKYNPKVNDWAAALPGFAQGHPYQDEELSQGALELMYRLEQYLQEIAGMERVTLQPAAGAHGELTGIYLIRAYHDHQGNDHKTKIIIPDSAHGTNPATVAMGGYDVIEVPSDERGGIDLDALDEVLDDDIAGLMLTNPNTLGLFDENIHKIAKKVHEVDGLLYYDGANANAILGYSRPGDMGFDIVHFNLHKTFATPHGGGGPGSGPVGVTERLVKFLPVPLVEKVDDSYVLDYDRPHSLGRMRVFWGNFGVLVRAYAYIRANGPDGLKAVSENAVLNANYLMEKLKESYDLPFDRWCKHEFVLAGTRQKKQHDVATLDIAKRLLDFGFHPPTIYFPLIVQEALMVEPTETETVDTLDAFVEAMEQIADEAEQSPETVREAPHTTPVGRLDEARAARQPDLRWTPETE